MRVKELKRTVNVAWSPAEQQAVQLAAGSAAQQVDASFSSSAQLELYSLNLDDPGYDLELVASLPTKHKFQKIVWSPAGIVIGGCDGGHIEFYGAEKLLKNTGEGLLGSMTKHNGHVSALDVNPYQKNLIASGASDSEIFIWDLHNTAQPMAPGTRNQPYDHVQGLAWNQQVQHILGSTFASRCVVWDLRKNEPIMKLSDSTSRTRWRALAWHPSVATQLCIASEDDQAPVIQLWDLRLAASPLVTLEGHNKGAMALSWCKQDSDLLLSAGKDGRVLCWNPNNTRPGGELLSEISQQQQWVFDVAWCPRNPNLLAASSFDQQMSVYSLFGGSKAETSTHNQSNIMDSFGGLDGLSALPAVQRPLATEPSIKREQQPPRAPKWMARPVAARFAFGGKLVTFEKCPQEAATGSQKLVYISQVVSEPEMVERAAELDTVLGSSMSQDPVATERLAEYCRQKGDLATDQHERYTWFFLRANFLPTFKSEVLNLLGFKQDEIPSRFKSGGAGAGAVGDTQPESAGLSRGESTETEAELSTDTSTDLSDAHTLIERKLANVDLGPTVSNIVIPNGDEPTSLICRALVCGNLEEAVELCLEANRVADALIIASLGSQELVYKVQRYHLKASSSSPISLLAGSLLASRWEALVEGVAAKSWRDALAALVTHTDGEALSHYCEMLGDKLSSESDPSLQQAATICYLCAMSPSALLPRWAEAQGSSRQSVAGLARLTELALLARRAAAARGRQSESMGGISSVLQQYASRLAAQGCLQSALNVLEGSDGQDLQNRLRHALGLIQPQRTTHQPTTQFGSRARTTSGHDQRTERGHVLAHNDVSNTYNAVPSMYETPNVWGGVPSSIAPPAAAPAPAPPIAAPPRPGSVGPQTAPSGGITSRSKYKVDPSVASAPLYNQYGFGSAQSTGAAAGYGYNSPLPEQYGASSVPGFTPINPMNPGAINANPAPINQQNGFYGQSHEAPPTPAAPPATAKPVPPGWNDPPAMHAKPKPKQEVPAQAPITHPLFGVEAPQHVPLNPAAPYPGQQYPAQQYAGQQYPGQQFSNQQQYPGQQQQYPGQQQQYPGQQQQYPGQQQYVGQEQQYPAQQYPATQGYPQPASSPAPPPSPVPKPPLPESLQPLQNVFDSLRQQCAERAANPQMKRKLEDVQKRLETLYDMLRENRLSESAVSALQSCASSAASGDYPSASAHATALATGADFASAASFLPALKVLMQAAPQLQVYLH